MSDKKLELEELIGYHDDLENYFRDTIIPQLYVDSEMKLQKFTPPAMKQFNLSFMNIGNHISELSHNLRFPTIVDNIKQVIWTNEILEKEIQTTDKCWYQMNIIPYVKMKDHKMDGVIITFFDITRRIKDLKDQEKLIEDNALLIDTISHDLKTPVANLTVVIELLKSEDPNNKEEFSELLTAVDNSLGQLNKVIGELTNIRRVEENSAKGELLNIEHILEDVQLTLQDNIANEDAKIISEIKISEINFSRRNLRSIIYNLLNNAIKFKAPDRQPEVIVTTYKEREHIVISVKDNGRGIPESQFETIFTKYGRIDNGIEGTGVGLYLVKEMVTNAGGKISVNSEVGVGTEFKVYLKKKPGFKSPCL